jgi:hypothetical protein
MPKRWLVGLLVCLCFGPLAMAAQNNTDNTGTWSGIIINSSCTPEQAFDEADACMSRVAGAPVSFYDDTTRQIFALDSQEQAASLFGEVVTVHGTVDGKTMHVASIERLTSIGLAVGQKAPNFTVRDQFGKEQSLDTLKGPNGTALLFFRSADW